MRQARGPSPGRGVITKRSAFGDGTPTGAKTTSNEQPMFFGAPRGAAVHTSAGDNVRHVAEIFGMGRSNMLEAGYMDYVSQTLSSPSPDDKRTLSRPHSPKSSEEDDPGNRIHRMSADFRRSF